MKSIKLSINKYVVLALSIALTLLYFVFSASLASAQQGVVTPDNSAQIAPTLSVVQNNQNLEVIASDNNLDINSWQRSGPFVSDPNCEDDGTVYNRMGNGNRFLVLTEADNNQWYCFKVADFDNNIGYAEFQVLGVEEVEEVIEEPEEEEPAGVLIIEIEQDGTSIIAQANRGLKGEPTWQVVSVDAPVNCNGEYFRSHSRQVFESDRVSGLSWRDNGQHYCFRLAEGEGSFVYGSIEVVGLAAPAGVDQEDDDEEEDDTTVVIDEGNEGDENADEDENAAAAEDEDEDDEDGAAAAEDEDDDNLRSLGIGVVVVGILAIIAVIFFSKRQPDQDVDEDDL